MMTGLDAILHEITKEAENSAAQIQKEAQEKVDALLKEAEAKGSQQAEEVLKSGELQAEDIRKRAHSAAALDKRNGLLQKKQQLIAQVIDDARAALENAEAAEYFGTLLKLIARFALPGSGELFLNDKDLSRLPADFPEALKQAVPQSQIAVSQTPVSIEGGFLLRYGGIDINGTFRAIFESAFEELRDAVGAILFPEG